MQRSSFTVTVRREKSEVSYDADCLMLGWRNITDGAVSTLTFRSSGGMETVDAVEVVNVEFHQAGASHCPYCDGTIWDQIGSGIHAGTPYKPLAPVRESKRPKSTSSSTCESETHPTNTTISDAGA